MSHERFNFELREILSLVRLEFTPFDMDDLFLPLAVAAPALTAAAKAAALPPPPPLPLVRCDAGHEMVLSDEAYPGGFAWSCDRCTSADNRDERWWCEQCGSDFCFQCAPAPARVRTGTGLKSQAIVEGFWSVNIAVHAGLTTPSELASRFLDCVDPKQLARRLALRNIRSSREAARLAVFPRQIHKEVIEKITSRRQRINEAQDIREQRERRGRMSSRDEMVFRMFHPTNGRDNFDPLSPLSDANEGAKRGALADSSVDEDNEDDSFAAVPLPQHYTLPSAAVMAQMCLREETLRLLPSTQAAYASKNYPNPLRIAHLIQLAVVREFGFPDSFVRLLRSAASLYSRQDLPFEKLPHYVRFNRSAAGHLREGDPAPDVPLALLSATLSSPPSPATCPAVVPTRLRALLPTDSRPLVVAAGSFT